MLCGVKKTESIIFAQWYVSKLIQIPNFLSTNRFVFWVTTHLRCSNICYCVSVLFCVILYQYCKFNIHVCRKKLRKQGFIFSWTKVLFISSTAHCHPHPPVGERVSKSIVTTIAGHLRQFCATAPRAQAKLNFVRYALLSFSTTRMTGYLIWTCVTLLGTQPAMTALPLPSSIWRRA